MAKELLVSVAIGAVLQASYLATFSGARKTLGELGNSADTLRKQHGQMGKALAQAMASPRAGIGALRQQYDSLGQAIARVQARQKALRASMQHGQALGEARQQHLGGLKESAATAVAVGAPLLGAVKQAASFEAGLRDIAITGNLKMREEIALGNTLRQSALATSQGHEAILQGVGTLVAQGMSATEAGKYAALLGKAATATNADMNDLARMMFSLSGSLGIKGESHLKAALNRAAYGAKLGQFELKAMAQYLPTLTSTFAAKGMQGQAALTQIIASLEVGRSAAGSDGEAVTNLVNWMSHMNTGHTTKAYSKAGVDYQQSMQNLVAQGYSSYEASLQIADKFITGKGKAFMAQWQKAGKAGDENAQRQLMESFGLSEIFTDIQTINHLLAMRQNWDKYQQNKKQMASPQAQGTIDTDYARRAQTAQKAWQRFTTQVSDVAITIGNALLPSLTSALDAFVPMLKRFGDWAGKHPGVLRGIIGVVGGMVALRTAAFGLKFLGNFLFLAPANAVGTAWQVLTGRFALLRAMVAGGGARLPQLLQLMGMGARQAGRWAAGLGRLGSGLAAVSRQARALGAGLGGRLFAGLGSGMRMALSLSLRLGAGLGRLGLHALRLGAQLGGSLIRSLLGAGRAVLWLGRALMLNPIGLAITAIALGAWLIYRHWDKIKPWFSGLWQGIKQSMTTAWDWMRSKIAGFVVYWRPVVAYVQALPGRFLQFGQDMVMGLVGGIKAKVGTAMAAVGDLASGVAGKFKSALGIRSPSRVFMGFGDNIGQGAAIGIGRTAGIVARATAGMALATTSAWGQPALPIPVPGISPATSVTQAPPRQALAPGLASRLPAPAHALQAVRQRLLPATALTQASLQQGGTRHLVNALPAPADVLQTVRQRIITAAKPALAPLQQAVTRHLVNALPAPADALQTVRQRLLPATALAPVLQRPGAGVPPRTPYPPPVLASRPPVMPAQQWLAARLQQTRAATPARQPPGRILFSPQITLQPGTAKEVQQQVKQAMQLSFAEFERMMKRYEADKQRRSYGGNS
jgi:TP901 family phage tail tape measure protein